MSLLVTALLLEWWLGDPPNRWHPVAWFGRWALWCETHLYQNSSAAGLWAWLLAVVPALLIINTLYSLLGWSAGALLLWYSIGWRSLYTIVTSIFTAPSINHARQLVAMVVSRDTATMQTDDIHRAALESLAENSSDAVIAPLFWFVVAGPVAAALYRMINTLDATWGYRNSRYHNFGRVAAVIDDAANWFPARITALLLLLNGRWRAWSEIKQQAESHPSPNAGWPEAALAFAAEIRLGGAVVRDGVRVERPWYGTVMHPLTPQECQRAVQLVQQTLLMAAATALLITLVR
ncbi:MAG: adenosylcobinamide-phosphate synthase CbiB [Mariprofundales bacterium]|nr:adenosylcobinamide-phosphate synthase CbiB [Mariprofundales bacterium]